MKVGVHFSCSALEGQSWADIYESALTQAEIADELGYDSAVVSEHHFKAEGWIPSPFVLCGAIAARTERIRIGTDIVILPFAHPLRIAEDILTLDNLSRGRAILGGGMGHSADEFARFGVPYKQRVSRSEEALTVLRRAFHERSFAFEGAYSTFDETSITPRPFADAPPIWYGAISAAGARRAARLADALVIGPSLHVDEVAEAIDAYHDELRLLGREGTGEVHLRREVALAESSAEAWDTGLAPLHYQASHIYSDFPREGTDAEFREFVHGRYLVGDPAEMTAEIHGLRKRFGDIGLLLRFQLPGTSNAVAEASTRLFGEAVLSALP
jgi:Coenzyme F420-dependent N5,N10-methylene tetrahydromethanopterin reductase and related flavin-dependent oxidoreductases